MDNTKRAIADEATEKEIPRAAYEGVLTIDVDAQVESMEEQEDARWHQLLNCLLYTSLVDGGTQQGKTNIHIVGDVKKVGNLKTAIWEAYDLAFSL